MACDLEFRSNVPKVGICAEKQHLMEELTAAIREVLLIQQQQFKAVIANDSDFARFDILLEMANSKKRQSKYAYMNHVETHGC